MKRLPVPLACGIAALLAFATVFAADAPKAKPTPTPQEAAKAAAQLALDFPPQPPVKALSPEEELKTFTLPPGYSLELVLSEKDGIKEPVNITFDGNGRMYLAEMRTYMQDVDGNNEHDPISVVSRHESTKGDGKFDKHTVFADKLILPRMVLPLDDRVLINETDTFDIYAYTDTKGTGVADKKELWYSGGPRGGNLEHQQSGLVWAMDNWIYQTYNAYRLRVHGKEALKETTPANSGQWGLAQDNYGKLWWSNAGGEKGIFNFQTPIIYGAYNVKDQWPEDALAVWPIKGWADVQGGPNRFRPEDKTLNHVTSTAGQQIVRADRMPKDLQGDVLMPEPVGRLIRRWKVEMKDGITTIHNPYEKSEFIRSTDPNFRPVSMENGPDGCMYIVDMYRGIIQEGNWVKADSYLRKPVLQYSMDKITGHGRVWRLVHKDFKPGPQPHMLGETPAQLVAHLDHPNGWWRDTAQKLIVLKGDKSVVPALQKMAATNANPLARIHALWTLEGLEAINAPAIRAAMKDKDANVRVAAIRVSESLFKKGDASLLPDVQSMAQDADPSVVLQVIMTGKLLTSAKAVSWPDYDKFAQFTMAGSASKGVKDLGALVFTGGAPVGGKEFSKEEIAVLEKGQGIFKELCFACHGFDGKGMPMEGAKPGTTMAPPLAGAHDILGHRDAAAYVLLNGLSGPVNGKTYDAQMVPMNSNDDAWIAAVASYVRNSFGNHGAMLTTADVARIRAETKDRAIPWTVEELKTVLPHPLENTAEWKVSASHNNDGAKLAIDGKADTRWDTHGEQVPNQWYQVELPEETVIVAVKLDQGKSANDYPRGYKLEVSADGKKWNRIAQGKGLPGVTEISFAPVKTKFIKITQTGSQKGTFWSIHELSLMQPSAKATLASKK